MVTPTLPASLQEVFPGFQVSTLAFCGSLRAARRGVFFSEHPESCSGHERNLVHRPLCHKYLRLRPGTQWLGPAALRGSLGSHQSDTSVGSGPRNCKRDVYLLSRSAATV